LEARRPCRDSLERAGCPSTEGILSPPSHVGDFGRAARVTVHHGNKGRMALLDGKQTSER
jgi:hypothetical protein